MSDLEGITIGHYRITCLLTQGGMSEIYLAQDRIEKRMVAIKVVHNSNREYYERFCHEVQTISSLQHKHILPALDYGQYESWYYLVTPYISYGTLNERLALGALSLEEAGKILGQLAAALQFSHEQGIVHRDIKPSNVLLDEGEHVYLADFGLAKKMGEDKSFTLTGIMMGTPDYMAPELAEEPASPRSDIYALGVLLYQMLTGKLPFRACTPMAVFLKHISEQPQRPSVYNTTIPGAVEQVILHALQKDPRKRFSTVADMLDAYRRALTAETPSVVTLAAQATFVPFQIKESLPLSRQQLKLRPHPTQAAIGVIAFLLLLPLSIGLTYYEIQKPVSTLPRVSSVSIVPVTPVTPKTSPGKTLKRAAVQQDHSRAQLHQQQYDDQGQKDKHFEDSNASQSTWSSQNNDDGEKDNGRGGKKGQSEKSGK